MESGIAPEVCAKVGGNRRGIAAQEAAQQYQSQERGGLGKGKYVLHHRAGPHAENVEHGKENHYKDGHQVLGVQADIHVAQHHGADGDGRHVRDVPDPVRRRDGRKEDAHEFAEGHAYRGDGSRLDDEKQGPAVEESPQWAQRFAQVNILATGARHHGRQFTVGESAGDGQEPGHEPGGDEQRGRIDQPSDLRRDNEDA